MREVTVRGAIFVDFTRRKTWGQLTDGTTTAGSPKFTIPDSLKLLGIEIYEDGRVTHYGADFDNLKLEIME